MTIYYNAQYPLINKQIIANALSVDIGDSVIEI